MEDFKYSKDGQLVQVIEKAKEGYLVNYVYNDDGEEFIDDDMVFIKNVFDSAPTPIYDKRVYYLQNKITEMREELEKLNKKMHDETRKYNEELKKFDKIPELKHLMSFIDGKFTHYVSMSYGTCAIYEVKEGLINCGSDSFKLVTLFGRSNGRLEWRISEYSDGSGGSTRIEMCFSHEEALSICQKYIDEMQKSRPTRDYREVAEKYNLKLNDEYLSNFKKNQTNSIEKSIKANEDGIKKLRDRLSKL